MHHHHIEDRADVREEALPAILALHGLVTAAARAEVDGNVQFRVLLERVGKYCSTFVKILIDVTTNCLFERLQNNFAVAGDIAAFTRPFVRPYVSTFLLNFLCASIV
jgi:hypothetical protein